MTRHLTCSGERNIRQVFSVGIMVGPKRTKKTNVPCVEKILASILDLVGAHQKCVVYMVKLFFFIIMMCKSFAYSRKNIVASILVFIHRTQNSFEGY